MGLTIVFTFLFVVALVTPMLWLTWWGAGSIARPGSRVRVVSVPAGGPRGRSRVAAQSWPHPADLRLAGSAGAITVCLPGDGAALETCQGPDHDGLCPRRLADGTVPCAGHLLALPRPVRGSTEWHIPEGYGACLLGGYGVYRQAAPDR